MARKNTSRCRKISEITDKMTDEAIKFYDKGELSRFWAAVESLNLLLEVEMGVCELE